MLALTSTNVNEEQAVASTRPADVRPMTSLLAALWRRLSADSRSSDPASDRALEAARRAALLHP
jgi:hypothetical protein